MIGVDKLNIQITKDAKLKDKITKYIQDNGVCPDGKNCLCPEIINQGIGPCKCGLYIKTEA